MKTNINVQDYDANYLAPPVEESDDAIADFEMALTGMAYVRPGIFGDRQKCNESNGRRNAIERFIFAEVDGDEVMLRFKIDGDNPKEAFTQDLEDITERLTGGRFLKELRSRGESNA